ncbi:hypothetical protein INS49_005672 [Diaporthe citri]|uniref:uncharacterized protein n=1 Tax=Diaporthe citri TaxID=83186 RepID=UPI001C7E7B74|nr:uncharacterized protein INS49_005672 [Diaporthe citri]KAG6353491.1 hypothetical protein INS49_005672 [Diaporthe citri]
MDNSQDGPGKGTILVTGANGSLGSTMASQITSTAELAAYHHGLYAVRDSKAAPVLRTAVAQHGSKDTSPHTHDIISLNLADLDSVRAVAATINSRVAAGEIPPIRALILNGGYLEFTSQSWTADGFDMTFASNYLGHWLLTVLLLQSMDREAGRVVVVGSESHDPHNPKSKAPFDGARWLEFMRDGSSESVARGMWSTSEEDPSYSGGFRRYGASKFCQAMMIPELQRRLDTDPALSNICILGVDPGSMPGNLTRRGPWFIWLLMYKLIMPWLAPLMAWLQPNGPLRTLKLGAADVIAGAFRGSPPPNGGYFYGSRVEEMTAEAQDVKKRERLWVETVGHTGLKEGETSLEKWM